MLCLALHAASRAMTSRYRASLKPFGLTYPQYLVLQVLQQDGPSSLVAVGTELRLESSTLSPLVRRLETLNLVTRARSAEDERAVVVELTAPGIALCERMRVVPPEMSVATGLEPAEQAALMDQLHRLERNLRDGSTAT